MFNRRNGKKNSFDWAMFHAALKRLNVATPAPGYLIQVGASCLQLGQSVAITSESGSPPSFAGEAIKVLLLGESIGETDVVSHQANNKGNPDERNKVSARCATALRKASTLPRV